jgi:isopentenyl-diphosphate delta-isomerase
MLKALPHESDILGESASKRYTRNLNNSVPNKPSLTKIMTEQIETRTEVVSDEAELLILVDSEDQPIGELDKAACHNDEGKLHRAFSLFVLNSKGQILLQKRAKNKRLWGGYWSNSCCSHPRAGESIADAVLRRSEQELGLAVDAKFVYKFEYSAKFGEAGSERELCSVYVAQTSDEPVFNTEEISACRWVSPAKLAKALVDNAGHYTPWLKMEWDTLRRDHSNVLRAS